MSVTRREFLLEGAVGLAALCGLPGCNAHERGGGQVDGGGQDDGGGPPPAAPDLGADLGGIDATPQCAETDDNIEGPYYRPGAPMRTDLVDPGMPGVHLALSGRVVSARDCTPLADALLDFWQADTDGHYDNDGHINPLPPTLFILRGQQYADADGNYSLRTIVPGHYLNGAQYRPAHIHVKVSAPGFVLLTTQLYFAGDPYNAIDPFIKPSLIMAVADASDGKSVHFDFALVPSTGP
jgi:protocatechuate 3,4-dioxygenase beta subunit